LPANALTITVVLAMAWLAHHVPASTRRRHPAQSA
jgi:hypothetical protein